MKHLHLDPLGGIAGDMFAAALLDAMPEHAPAVAAAVERLAGVPARPVAHRDHVLRGHRFEVAAAAPHDHDHHHGHDHTHWSDIRDRIGAAGLPDPVARHALGIFAALADAEAEVHGVPVDDVAFHEVGAVDSIADIVAAAVLIAACGEASWSVGPLPLGGGRVRTRSTARCRCPRQPPPCCCDGFAFVDDGISGERVTPTGAAILRHLGATPSPGRPGRRLAATGTGFGTRTLAGISNCLRVLVFEAAGGSAGEHRDAGRDRLRGRRPDRAEDLAAGLDRLRATPGVHDVIQMPVVGKKARLGHPRPGAGPPRRGRGGRRCLLPRDHDHRPAHAPRRGPRAAAYAGSGRRGGRCNRREAGRAPRRRAPPRPNATTPATFRPRRTHRPAPRGGAARDCWMRTHERSRPAGRRAARHRPRGRRASAAASTA